MTLFAGLEHIVRQDEPLAPRESDGLKHVDGVYGTNTMEKNSLALVRL
jgi:hypothetical protein